MAFNGISVPTERRERSLSPITNRLKHLRHESSKIRNVNLPSGDKQSMSNHKNQKGSTSTSSASTLEDWCKDVQGDLSKSEQYSILIQTIISAMEEELERYKDNPQSHPQYPAEWNKFWEKRSNELEAAGEDPYKHNFNLEWSVFFMNRINELHEADIKRKKLDVRKILGIPHNAIAKYQPTESSSTVRKPAGCSIPTNRESSLETKSRGHVEKVAMLIENKSSGKRKFGTIGDNDENANLDDNDKTLTVISVLRLLTAFEDMLGSLGPKVVDLLSKAVAQEKVRPNMSDELLMSTDNSIFLDTVKEKLKGLIIAGMVQNSKQEQAIKQAIRNLSLIVRLIDSKRKASEHSTKAPAQHLVTDEESTPVQYQLNLISGTNSSPSSVEKVKRFSEAERREDVLKQLETSFILQGRNVSNQHLNELVDVYLANHSPKDTPYLFGLEMGKRLVKMENEQNPVQSSTSVPTGQPFNRFHNNDQQTRSVELPRRNHSNDQLTMLNYQQMPYGNSIQQPISQYSNVSYEYDQMKLQWSANDQMKGLQPWNSGMNQSQSPYQSSRQQQGQQQYPHPQNAYCQPPNIYMGHQQQYRTPYPMNQFNNQMYENLPSGQNHTQMQTHQGGQWYPRAGR